MTFPPSPKRTIHFSESWDIWLHQWRFKYGEHYFFLSFFFFLFFLLFLSVFSGGAGESVRERGERRGSLLLRIFGVYGDQSVETGSILLFSSSFLAKTSDAPEKYDKRVHRGNSEREG